MERDGGFVLGGRWAAEQCKGVCCEMDPRRSGWKVRRLVISGGQVEDGSGSSKSLLQERMSVFGWEIWAARTRWMWE